MLHIEDEEFGRPIRWIPDLHWRMMVLGALIVFALVGLIAVLGLANRRESTPQCQPAPTLRHSLTELAAAGDGS